MKQTSKRVGPTAPRSVRLALLGVGEAARNIHLPACRRVPGVRLVAAADPEPAARAAFSALAPGLPLFDAAERLFEAEQPDWVIVGAPPSAHRELCLLAFERGAHVFCEKPLVEHLGEADELIRASELTGRTLAVNHEFARMPIFESVRHTIGSEEFGELLFLQAWEHLDERVHQTEGWRSECRTMREFGTHVVDLAIGFYGGMPDRVISSMPRPIEMGDADLIDVVILEFPRGRVASIVLDRVCRGAHRYLEMRLDGEHASLRASLGGRAGFSLSLAPRRSPGARLDWAGGGQVWLEKGERRRVLSRNSRNAFAAATARMLEEAIDATSRGEPPPCSAREARNVLSVVEAAYVSARTGQPVSPSRLSGDDRPDRT